MDEVRHYIHALLQIKKLTVPPDRMYLFEGFISEEHNISAVNKIIETQKMLTDKWKLKNRVTDISQQSVIIPNATVGKPYEATLDLNKLGWTDFAYANLEGLGDLGLAFEHNVINGVPVRSGDLKLSLKYRLQGEPEDSDLNEKVISLVINPDPKSLWKTIASNREDPYWKADNVAVADKLGDRHIVVASKRGRSHANVGSFRDDDFAYRTFGDTGWSVVVVSDGAGSAAISRKGSDLACKAIVEFFEQHIGAPAFSEIDKLMQEHNEGTGEDTLKKLNHFVYNNLGQAALTVYKKLDEFATGVGASIKDLHATLIFTLLKKYPFGYAILSFGVGDCPIGLVNKDLTAVTLMNWLDVGEFGGGTRFITMPEIFSSDKFATRFGFKVIEDFSYLVLMTDGIYDPKFVVEANLEKVEQWREFFDDLQGKNDDGMAVHLKEDNPDVARELSKWMDFWSPGNHDDRTLAIVF